jgi:hypothetical protein
MRQSIHKAAREVVQEHNPDMGAGRFAVLAAVTLLAACGGGGEDNADEPDCPTTTTAVQPSAMTTTIDPRCVQRATETSDEATGQVWKGTISTTESGPGMTGTTEGAFTATVGPDGVVSGSGGSHSEYSNAAPIDSHIAVSGKRDGDVFRLSLAHTPGTRVDVEPTVRGNVAEGSINLTGELGTYSRGTVRLECEDCG